MFKQLTAQWMAFSLFFAAIQPSIGQSKGPVFTLPKTAVILDMSVQKFTLTPIDIRLHLVYYYYYYYYYYYDYFYYFLSFQFQYQYH